MPEEKEQSILELPDMRGGELMIWEFEPQAGRERGRTWYVVAALVGIGLLGYSLAVSNFLFALIVLMVALVVFVSSIYRPQPVRVALRESGVEFGPTFFPYGEMAKFWFCYQPPEVKCLYLEFRKGWRPQLRVELEDVDPNAVRECLIKYLKEDLNQTEEPLADTLSRVLKL